MKTAMRWTMFISASVILMTSAFQGNLWIGVRFFAALACFGANMFLQSQYKLAEEKELIYLRFEKRCRMEFISLTKNLEIDSERATDLRYTAAFCNAFDDFIQKYPWRAHEKEVHKWTALRKYIDTERQIERTIKTE